ncbi:MAG: ABC transporter substrate-binding protein [Gammaproteobacteria bacterium]|nr:ABC transporter substrate-binding protein [Gammaproteobacteria bacterium]
MNTTSRHALGAWLALGLAACSGGGGGGDVDDDPIRLDASAAKIGLLFPQSGPSATFGVDHEYAALLAIREINAAGGVNGQRLELIVKDSRRGLPDNAATVVAAVDALADEGVVAVIGPSTSGEVLLMKDRLVARNLPLISPAATSPALSSLADNGTIWRTPPSDAFQGGFLAGQIQKSGVKTLAVIYRDDTYGRGLAGTLVERYQALGGRVLNQIAYPPSQSSGFEAPVSALLASGVPEGIVIVGFNFDSANILIALSTHSLQPFPALFGVDGNRNPPFLDNSPPLVEGMRGSAPTPARDSPNYLGYTARYQAATGKTGSAFSEGTYDAVYLIALAMAKGHVNNREAVLTRLGEVSRPDGPNAVAVNPNEWAQALAAIDRDIDFQGASGKIDWDGSGDVTAGTYAWWQVQRGPAGLRFVELESAPFP